MVEILDRTAANFLVRFEDGTVDSYPLSPQNRLLFDHNLWGILKTGDEILEIGGDPAVTIVPNEDATEYEIHVVDDNREALQLGPDMKPRLIDALHDVYRQDNDDRAEPLVAMYDEIWNNRVRRDVINEIGDQPPFYLYEMVDGTLEKTDNGWLFHDELLLTWEAELRHPNKTTYRRDGSIVGSDVANPAYQLSGMRLSETPEVELNNKKTELTEREMEFLTKALWAAEVIH